MSLLQQRVWLLLAISTTYAFMNHEYEIRIEYVALFMLRSVNAMTYDLIITVSIVSLGF